MGGGTDVGVAGGPTARQAVANSDTASSNPHTARVVTPGVLRQVEPPAGRGCATGSSAKSRLEPPVISRCRSHPSFVRHPHSETPGLGSGPGAPDAGLRRSPALRLHWLD